ncbi:MAG: hypothetical protein ACH34U_05230 [Cyanobium sp.]
MKRKVPLIPFLLLGLALADLKLEIRLLLDHFTLTTLLVAIQNHLLAFTILALLPSLWRRYRGDQA